MATGNLSVNNSTAGSGTMTIQPSSGQAYIVRNIIVTGAATVEFFDGTTTVVVANLTASSPWLAAAYGLHLTNGCYIKVVDTSGASNPMHWDGYQVA